MDRRVFQAIVVAFVAITLFLGGCGDSDETKGERLLGQAETLMQQDNELQAEQVLIDLIAKYPETQSRVAASNHLLQKSGPPICVCYRPPLVQSPFPRRRTVVFSPFRLTLASSQDQASLSRSVWLLG